MVRRAIGTVGLAAEWGWSHVWMPIPWPAEILPEVAAIGLAAALAGSLIGAYIGARLGADDIPQAGGLRWAGLAGAVAMAALVAFGLHTPATSTGATAKVTLRDVDERPERTAIVTARMIPASAADDATWLTATSWQGGGLIANRLKEIRRGVYQSTEPIPIHGDYKTLIRLHTGNAIIGPAGLRARGRGDPGAEVPAPARLRAAVHLRHDAAAARGQDERSGDHGRRVRHHRVLHVRADRACSPGACTASA